MGPNWNTSGGTHHFGGHASQAHDLNPNAKIEKVEICRNEYELRGMRIHTSDGAKWGELNRRDGRDSSVETLKPDEGMKIIGFFGASDFGRGFDGIQEFGILTVQKDIEVPEKIFDMAEFKNADGGIGPVSARPRFGQLMG
jgi:hypothetical protein